MEGRAIQLDLPVRGRLRCLDSLSDSLQWRAEQLPGQTGPDQWRFHPQLRCCFNGGPSNCPAKPSSTCAYCIGRSHLTLQWRAEQLPGQTVSPQCFKPGHDMARTSLDLIGIGAALQWRAEQLPGQTARLIWGG